ncbi:hypothetical protein [Brevibacillus borstelensis]|uniref:hypothetical protein n=1 Tax=Brevibacillus borstelensis TaxID=45462 RepID=UPI0030BE0362
MRQFMIGMLILGGALFLFSGCSSKDPYSTARDSLNIDDQTYEALRSVTMKAREDAESIGYQVSMVDLPNPAVIYQDGKPLGAYMVHAAAKSQKDAQKDIVILYYFLANQELMVRIPMGEADGEYEKYQYRPENIAF